jgi:hypothetical protein
MIPKIFDQLIFRLKGHHWWQQSKKARSRLSRHPSSSAAPIWNRLVSVLSGVGAVMVFIKIEKYLELDVGQQKEIVLYVNVRAAKLAT